MLSCSAIVLCLSVFRLQRITSGKPRSSDSSQSSGHTSTRTELQQNCYHFQQGLQVQQTIHSLNATHAKASVIVAKAKVVGIASLRSRESGLAMASMACWFFVNWHAISMISNQLIVHHAFRSWNCQPQRICMHRSLSMSWHWSTFQKGGNWAIQTLKSLSLRSVYPTTSDCQATLKPLRPPPVNCPEKMIRCHSKRTPGLGAPVLQIVIAWSEQNIQPISTIFEMTRSGDRLVTRFKSTNILNWWHL